MNDDEPRDLEEMGAKWIQRIRDAEKREHHWMKNAEAAEKAYLSDGTDQREGQVYSFNILHSNVATMQPAIYNSTPVPDVRERFRTGDGDAQGALYRQVSQVIERALMAQADDGALDVEMEMLTQDAILAGRGVIRIRFDADEEEAPITDEFGQPYLGEDGQPEMEMRLSNERILFENVSWRDYREGPAKRWGDVPWVAFKQCVPWEEICRIRDPELKKQLQEGSGEKEPDGDSDTILWEIWDKQTRQVLLIVENSKEIIQMMDDPLGLSDFFPCTRPVQPVQPSGERTPVCPFAIYRDLAQELEDITRRIKAIIAALRVRGFIIGDSADLDKINEAVDNQLVPIANIEGIIGLGGLDKMIAWWPIDMAIAVLRELYAARESTKQMIYEITGISDIVRGQGDASETATAQEIKTRWGSLRIQRLQKQIERCAREVFILCAEMVSTKFSPETLQMVSGVEVTEEMAQILSAPLDHYRIDIETDSTVRADLTSKRDEMARFLEGTAQFFNTMAPVVAQAPNLAEPMAQIFAAFSRQFNMGKQAEDAIETMTAQMAQAAQEAEQMKQQAAQAQEAEAEKARAEAEKTQAEMQHEERRVAVEEGELAVKQGELQVDAYEAQMRANYG